MMKKDKSMICLFLLAHFSNALYSFDFNAFGIVGKLKVRTAGGPNGEIVTVVKLYAAKLSMPARHALNPSFKSGWDLNFYIANRHTATR